MSIRLELPKDQDVHSLADWVELNALLEEDGNTSLQELVGLLSNGAENDIEEDQIADSPSEAMSADVMNELVRRSVACGDSYPFEVESSKITLKSDWKDYVSYVFPLLISYLGVTCDLFPEQYQYFGKYFEELGGNALDNYLSNTLYPASIKVFGFPRTDSSRFSKAVQELCDTIPGFRAIHLDLAAVQMDGGLDVIAWKQFPDDLSGSMVFLAQCAMGANWREKLHEARKIQDYITMPGDVLTGVFIPHTVDVRTGAATDQWEIDTNKAGRIFERCRTAYLSKNWSHEKAEALCGTTLANLSALMG